MRRLITVILMTSAILMAGNAVFAESAIHVTVNGAELEMQTAPVIANGRTLVPLRAIFEAMCITPEWDDITKTVSAKNDTSSVVLKIGSETASVNGKPVVLESPGILVNGSTMVPARFVAEAFGSQVRWDYETKTVEISTKMERRGKPLGNYGNSFAVYDNMLFSTKFLGPILKSNLDGSQQVVLVPSDSTNNYLDIDGVTGSLFGNLNIYNGCLYFTEQKKSEGSQTLFSVDLNGTGKKLVCEGMIKEFDVYEDRIYMLTNQGDIKRCNLDGSGMITLIKTDNANQIKINGGWVYYRTHKVVSDEKTVFSLYRMKTDGTAVTLIAKDNGIGSWTVLNEWVYYSIWDKGTINKISVDGIRVVKLSDVHAGDLKISDGLIYFREDTTGYIHRIKLDGTNQSLVTNQVTSYIFDIFGDFVYYDTYQPMLPYRAKTDGSTVQSLQ